MTISYNEINRIIANGFLEKAIKYSILLLETGNDSELKNNLVLISAQFNSNKRDFESGIKVQNNYEVSNNRIRVSLQSILEEAKEEMPNLNIEITEEPKKETSSNTIKSQLPDFFVEDLKMQLKEQYKKMLRFRELKNDEIDEELRQKYSKEIKLRQRNIKEIKSDFLDQAEAESSSVTKDELQEMTNQIVSSIKLELGMVSADLKDFIQMENQEILQKLEIDSSPEKLAQISHQIEVLSEQNQVDALALADIIMDVFEKQQDSEKKIDNLAPLIKSIRNTDVLEAKLKLAIPLLDYLGIAKVEAEINLDASNGIKKVWNKLKSSKMK